MEQTTSTHAPKPLRGRPRKSVPVDKTFGALTVIGPAPSPAGNIMNRTYVYCKCACGLRTEKFPCIVRLSYLQSGHTTSCGCIGKKQFKLNWESFAAKLGDVTVKAIFKAFARKPERWQEIARRFGVAKAMVGACYRTWMKKLAAMTQAAKSEALANISNFEQRCLDRKGHKYGAWSEPTGLELNDEDITDPHMRMMLGLCAA